MAGAASEESRKTMVTAIDHGWPFIQKLVLHTVVSLWNSWPQNVLVATGFSKGQVRLMFVDLVP